MKLTALALLLKNSKFQFSNFQFSCVNRNIIETSEAHFFHRVDKKMGLACFNNIPVHAGKLKIMFHEVYSQMSIFTRYNPFPSGFYSLFFFHSRRLPGKQTGLGARAQLRTRRGLLLGARGVPPRRGEGLELRAPRGARREGTRTRRMIRKTPRGLLRTLLPKLLLRERNYQVSVVKMS